MDEQSHRKRRLVAVVAATTVSLACGTNYAYSAWAPQFAEKLLLTATESNLIGTSANFGMYAMGIPFGYLCDKRGPYINTVIGAFAIGGGYFPLRQAFEAGPGSMSVTLLCFFSFLTGCGSCAAFTAAIKTAALNWPNHHGTATAFPLAAFGLSAFFFTSLSGILFPESTSRYLLLLVIGTFCMTFIPVFFIYVPPTQSYHALAADDVDPPRRDSALMHRPSHWRSKLSRNTQNPKQDGSTASGTSTPRPIIQENGTAADEASSLLSNESIPGDIDDPEGTAESMIGGAHSHSSSHHSHRADITGFQLVKTLDFWLLFLMLGVFTGIGLMTINNIGNDSNALWRAYDPDMDRDYITKRQLMHVSIISCTSFAGRLLSGVGSDILVKKLKLSRFWCMVVASCIFTLAQFIAVTVSNPYYLWLLSTIGGLGYGVLFGVYPALVADAFGVSGLSTNWGFMTIAPVIWGNIFNIWYGTVYDAHSVVLETGERVCYVGLDCYRNAYIFTAIASVCGIAVSLWVAFWDNKRKQRIRHEEHSGRLD